MKKSIYIAIISALTIFCIIYGSWIHISGFAKDMKSYFPFWNYSEKSETETNSNLPFSMNNVIVDSFQSIDADIKIGSITIETGDNYSYTYSSNKSWLIPEVKVENNKLKISQKGKSNTSMGNNSATIKITVPESALLDKTKVSVDVGELIIKNISTEKLEVEVDVGEAEIKKVTFDKADFDVDIGEINVNGIKDLSSYSIDAKASVGEVMVMGSSGKKYHSSASGNKYIKADVDIGDCRISE